jgi:hypothetical protein
MEVKVKDKAPGMEVARAMVTERAKITLAAILISPYGR